MEFLPNDGPTPDPAHGVFETLLVRDGAPLELDRHLARLAASTTELYGQAPPPQARALLEDGARELALGRIRVTVAPGPDGLSAELTSAAMSPALIFPDAEHAPVLRAAAVDGWNGAHKWADRRLLAGLEAVAAPAVPLLVGGGRTVLETSRGNVFAVAGDAVVTPPLDGQILPGVTRALVIEIARGLGLELTERPISYDELLAADEVFATGAVRGVESVYRCDPGGWWSSSAVADRVAETLRRGWGLSPATAG